MKSGNSIWLGMSLVLCGFLLGCGQVVAPVDTYGFKEAFEEHAEPQKGGEPLGKESITLAEDILKAVYSDDLPTAQSKLETLRQQMDLNPRQRLETKALHTAVVDYLSQSEDKAPEQNEVSSSAPSVRQSS